MSMAVTHFAVGAAGATLLLAYLPVETRYNHAFAVASGLWAMIPDFWRVVPVFRTLFERMHGSILANGFWLHRLLDRVDSADSHRLAAVVLGVYALVALIYAERQRGEPAFLVHWSRVRR